MYDRKDENCNAGLAIALKFFKLAEIARAVVKDSA
jgi:hypothetical protein